MKKTLKAIAIVIGVTIILTWSCWVLVWALSGGSVCRDCDMWIHVLTALSILAWLTVMVRIEIK